jgi:hypothetical protein
MATFIQVNGRFIIPTAENIKAIQNANLPQELVEWSALPLDANIEVVKAPAENTTEPVADVVVADEVTETVDTVVEPTAENIEADELATLRTQYLEKFEKKAFHWRDVETLKAKLAE